MSRAYGTPLVWTGKTFDFRTAIEQETTRSRGHGGVGIVWRVEAVRYSSCWLDVNGCENYSTSDPRLELFALSVLRWTPHGATLRETSGTRNRWVDLRDDAKQYASRTPAEAVEQFAARRRAQLYILAKQTARAERELALCCPAPFLPPVAAR